LTEPVTFDTNGYLGYTDRLSVPAGEAITFHVSSRRGDFRADILRVRCADADPDGPGLRMTPMPSAIDGEHQGVLQPIRPGSCVVVPPSPLLAPAAGLALGAYVFPTLIDDVARSVIACWSNDAGYALTIGPDGAGLRLGTDGAPVTVTTGAALELRRWYWISASLDPATGRVVVTQVRLADGNRPERRDTVDVRHAAAWRLDAGAPLVIGAQSAGPGIYTAHVDGKIERPRLYGAAIDDAALRQFDADPRPGAVDPQLVGLWDFSLGIPTLVATDLSANRFDGRLHQMPMRAAIGVRWDGRVQDWRLDPSQYGAIHFHSDDIVDCLWQPTLTLDVPADWRSGFYTLRLRPVVEDPAQPAESHIPFFVTPGKGQRRAKLAVIASTATFLAYANSALRLDHVHFEALLESVLVLTPDDVFLQENPELGQSTYDKHVDGSGRCHSSWRRPILNTRARSNPFNYAVDTHFLDWLEENGIEYDVLTDMELDRHGAAALQPYLTVATLSHPEYYTLGMMNALLGHQGRGGRHIYFGGNGFYWRCAFHPANPFVLEMRRGLTGTRTWESVAGEVHMAGTGEPGGLWRHSGFAPQKLVGVGFVAMVYDRSGWYVRQPGGDDPRAAFIFEGLTRDEPIGKFGLRYGGAVGVEIDRFDLELGSPPHALVVATSEGLGPGSLPSPEEFRTMVHGMGGDQNAHVRADMVFFETPGGGAVFSTGSISYLLSLGTNGYDNNISRLTGNVLRRFLDPAPFVVPDAC